MLNLLEKNVSIPIFKWLRNRNEMIKINTPHKIKTFNILQNCFRNPAVINATFIFFDFSVLMSPQLPLSKK